MSKSGFSASTREGMVKTLFSQRRFIASSIAICMVLLEGLSLFLPALLADCLLLD